MRIKEIIIIINKASNPTDILSHQDIKARMKF